MVSMKHPLKELARRILSTELMLARKNYMALDTRYCEMCEKAMTLEAQVEEIHKATNKTLVSLERKRRWEP